jgi:hypothetical protein
MALASIDPELLKQLANSPASTAVEATITLATPSGHGFMPAEEVGPKVKGILEEVGRAVGENHDAVNVFENIGSFAIRARPAFLKALLNRPEVISAMANQQSEEIFIRPVHKTRNPRT